MRGFTVVYFTSPILHLARLSIASKNLIMLSLELWVLIYGCLATVLRSQNTIAGATPCCVTPCRVPSPFAIHNQLRQVCSELVNSLAIMFCICKSCLVWHTTLCGCVQLKFHHILRCWQKNKSLYRERGGHDLPLASSLGVSIITVVEVLTYCSIELGYWMDVDDSILWHVFVTPTVFNHTNPFSISSRGTAPQNLKYDWGNTAHSFRISISCKVF